MFWENGNEVKYGYCIPVFQWNTSEMNKGNGVNLIVDQNIKYQRLLLTYFYLKPV
jgi:hypothetical protein